MGKVALVEFEGTVVFYKRDFVSYFSSENGIASEDLKEIINIVQEHDSIVAVYDDKDGKCYVDGQCIDGVTADNIADKLKEIDKNVVLISKRKLLKQDQFALITSVKELIDSPKILQEFSTYQEKPKVVEEATGTQNKEEPTESAVVDNASDHDDKLIHDEQNRVGQFKRPVTLLNFNADYYDFNDELVHPEKNKDNLLFIENKIEKPCVIIVHGVIKNENFLEKLERYKKSKGEVTEIESFKYDEKDKHVYFVYNAQELDVDILNKYKDYDVDAVLEVVRTKYPDKEIVILNNKVTPFKRQNYDEAFFDEEINGELFFANYQRDIEREEQSVQQTGSSSSVISLTFDLSDKEFNDRFVAGNYENNLDKILSSVGNDKVAIIWDGEYYYSYINGGDNNYYYSKSDGYDANDVLKALQEVYPDKDFVLICTDRNLPSYIEYSERKKCSINENEEFTIFGYVENELIDSQNEEKLGGTNNENKPNDNVVEEDGYIRIDENDLQQEQERTKSGLDRFNDFLAEYYSENEAVLSQIKELESKDPIEQNLSSIADIGILCCLYLNSQDNELLHNLCEKKLVDYIKQNGEESLLKEQLLSSYCIEYLLRIKISKLVIPQFSLEQDGLFSYESLCKRLEDGTVNLERYAKDANVQKQFREMNNLFEVNKYYSKNKVVTSLVLCDKLPDNYKLPKKLQQEMFCIEDIGTLCSIYLKFNNNGNIRKICEECIKTQIKKQRLRDENEYFKDKSLSAYCTEYLLRVQLSEFLSPNTENKVILSFEQLYHNLEKQLRLCVRNSSMAERAGQIRDLLDKCNRIFYYELGGSKKIIPNKMSYLQKFFIDKSRKANDIVNELIDDCNTFFEHGDLDVLKAISQGEITEDADTDAKLAWLCKKDSRKFRKIKAKAAEYAALLGYAMQESFDKTTKNKYVKEYISATGCSKKEAQNRFNFLDIFKHGNVVGSFQYNKESFYAVKSFLLEKVNNIHSLKGLDQLLSKELSPFLKIFESFDNSSHLFLTSEEKRNQVKSFIKDTKQILGLFSDHLNKITSNASDTVNLKALEDVRNQISEVSSIADRLEKRVDSIKHVSSKELTDKIYKEYDNSKSLALYTEEYLLRVEILKNIDNNFDLASAGGVLLSLKDLYHNLEQRLRLANYAVNVELAEETRRLMGLCHGFFYRGLGSLKTINPKKMKYLQDFFVNDGTKVDEIMKGLDDDCVSYLKLGDISKLNAISRGEITKDPSIDAKLAWLCRNDNKKFNEIKLKALNYVNLYNDPSVDSEVPGLKQDIVFIKALKGLKYDGVEEFFTEQEMQKIISCKEIFIDKLKEIIRGCDSFEKVDNLIKTIGDILSNQANKFNELNRKCKDEIEIIKSHNDSNEVVQNMTEIMKFHECQISLINEVQTIISKMIINNVKDEISLKELEEKQEDLRKKIISYCKKYEIKSDSSSSLSNLYTIMKIQLTLLEGQRVNGDVSQDDRINELKTLIDECNKIDLSMVEDDDYDVDEDWDIDNQSSAGVDLF